MNIYLLGMPQSGRTTVSKAICKNGKYAYIDAAGWAKNAFREKKDNEHPQQYHDEYHRWLTNRIKLNPWVTMDQIHDSMDAYDNKDLNYVIDGIVSPRDFINEFDYNHDIVIFLNRTDSDIEYKDYENIGISVMRDYCFWLASANLIDRSRWLEYNFKIPGEESDIVKSLGSKNSVFIIKSLNKVIEHIKGHLINLQGPQS